MLGPVVGDGGLVATGHCPPPHAGRMELDPGRGVSPGTQGIPVGRRPATRRPAFPNRARFHH